MNKSETNGTRYDLRDSHKRREKNVYIMLLVNAFKFIFDMFCFYFVWLYFRYGHFAVTTTIGFRYNFYITIGYLVLFYWFSRTYNAFQFGYFRIRAIAFSQFLSQVFAIALVYIGVSVAWRRVRNPLPFLFLLVVFLVFDVIWAYFGSWFFYKINPSKRTILIYRDQLARKRFGAIKGQPIERLFKIVDEIEYDGSFHELAVKLDDYDAVFVAGVNSRCRNGILKYCKEKGIPGFVLPHVGDAIMQEAKHIQSFDSPVLYVNRTVVDPIYSFFKRTFDILASGTAIIILSPLMLITALIIRLYDKGPAFYKQIRLTKDGREFKILKFRSMRIDAERDGVARLSSGDNDDRITPIGKIIRKCRIDELPQLFNIFKGDMSVVGPRPERPEIAEQYYEHIPAFNLRLQVKAGLTGYAQIYGKYNTDPYEKLEFDLLYINQMNFLTDLKLCFATFSILFLPESTTGIETGQMTALINENEYEDKA